MSFYGNVTNIFQFDEIYPNRAAMDIAAAAGTDNIFQNRFVLVKYNQEVTDKNITFTSSDIGFGYLYNGHMYVDAEHQEPYYFTTFSKVDNPVIENWDDYYYSTDQKYYYKLPNQSYFNDNETNYYQKDSNREHTVYKNQIFRKKDENGFDTFSLYICKSGTNNIIANFTELITESIDSNVDSYLINYNIDAAHYGSTFDVKGYDATVWQKEFVGNQGRFRLIATLNSTTPKIELTAEQPVLEPKNPYIDSSSTKDVYKIKVPSKWGMQIKEETNTALSDQQVIQTKYEYNSNSNNYISTQQQVNGAIYFNKAGMTPTQSIKNTSVTNEIILDYTGVSGKLYNGTTAVDTIDVSLHFPAIGNMVAEGYDLIYGINDDQNHTRPRDIEWYGREVNNVNSLITNGNSNLGGKTRNLETLAGVLNTFQDRLGQLIYYLPEGTTITNTQAASLNPAYIYAVKNNGKYIYYRIGKDYEYTIIPEYSSMGQLSAEEYEQNKYYIYTNNQYNLASSVYTDYAEGTEFFRKNIIYNLATVTQDNYEPNTYYLDNQGQNIAIENFNYYPNNQSFYKKNVSIFKFQEVQLIGYQENTFYYLDGNNNYLKDTKALVPTYKTLPYYNITSENETTYTFNYEYYPNTYYTKDENTNYYYLSQTSNPDLLTTYYGIDAVAISNGSQILYQPGKYFYYENYVNGNPVGLPILDEKSTITSGRVYWYIPLSSEIEYIYSDNQIIVGYKLDIEHKQRVSLFQPQVSLNSLYVLITDETGTYYRQVSTLSEEELLIAYVYYSLTIQTMTNCFIPNEYYRKDNNGNYYLQSSWSGDSNMIYYKLINITPLKYPFYEGGKYYYYNGNIYVPDDNVSKTHDTYYIGTSLYVWDDSSGRWPHGYEWQEQAIIVPASVTLATRKEVYKAFEMQDLSKNISSIHGALLDFNNFAAFSDIDTRDETTLNGVYNITKDLLYSINNNLIPGRILYINDYGQIAVSNLNIKDLEQRIITLESYHST